MERSEEESGKEKEEEKLLEIYERIESPGFN